MIEWCFISVIAEVAFNGEAYISSRSTSIEDDSLADNHDGDAFDRSTSTEDSFADNHDGGSPAEGTLVEDLLADNQDADMSNFRQLADFRLFCLVLGHSCESSRSGLIFTSVGGGGEVLSSSHSHRILSPKHKIVCIL